MDRIIGCLALALALAGAGPARSETGGYTNPHDFAAAVPGGVATLDFENAIASAPLSAPGAAADLLLPGSVPDVLGGPRSRPP